MSLGSNTGDRFATLCHAKKCILNLKKTHLLAQSKIYETEAVGVNPEHKDLDFLNAVLIVNASIKAEDWLTALHQIEYDLGRRRGKDWYAPRPIDIDILYFGNQCIDDGGLIVPHPQWMERRFVVKPLVDARPELVLPGTDRSVKEVLDALPIREKVVLWKETW